MEYAKVPPYIKAVFISLLIIIIIFFMVMAKGILVPLMLSGYIAMLLTPLCNRLEKKIPRSLAAFIALMLFILMITGVLYVIYTQFSSFMSDMQDNAMDNLNRFVIRINNSIMDFSGIDAGMGYGLDGDRIMKILKPGENGGSEILAVTLDTIFNIVLLPVYVFFLLIYRDHLAVFVTKVFEKHKIKFLLENIVSIRLIVHAYIVGAGKVMVILAIVNTIVLFSLGIKHALFFGVTAGLLNIIPYLGPMLGAIMPFIFALLTKDNLFYPIAVLISFTLIQFLEGTYLTPKITGANVNLNAFVTFLGLLIGGAIWGVVGMLLIIPTIAILKRLFELNPETEAYAYLFGEEDTRWFRRRRIK